MVRQFIHTHTPRKDRLCIRFSFRRRAFSSESALGHLRREMGCGASAATPPPETEPVAPPTPSRKPVAANTNATSAASKAAERETSSSKPSANRNARLREIFNSMDTDGDGSVDMAECKCQEGFELCSENISAPAAVSACAHTQTQAQVQAQVSLGWTPRNVRRPRRD